MRVREFLEIIKETNPLYEEATKKVSKEFLRFRKDNKISQEELAEYLGVNETCVKSIEDTWEDISLSLLCKIITLLDIDIKINRYGVE